MPGRSPHTTQNVDDTAHRVDTAIFTSLSKSLQEIPKVDSLFGREAVWDKVQYNSDLGGGVRGLDLFVCRECRRSAPSSQEPPRIFKY